MPELKNLKSSDNAALWPRCHSPSLDGYIALVVLYYCTGMLYFHIHMNIPIIDALNIVTAAVTASGPIITAAGAELQMTIFRVCGFIIALYILSGYIINDVRLAKRNTCLIAMNVYCARLLCPLLHMCLVISIGTVFFSLNENWPLADALYYSTVSRSAGVSKYGMQVDKFSSRVFLIMYLWVFATSLMSIISGLCALRIETNELIRLEVWETRRHSLMSARGVSIAEAKRNMSQYEFLVELLLHLGVLDREEHVDQWLLSIGEFSSSQNGILTSADVFAFVEAERRRQALQCGQSAVLDDARSAMISTLFGPTKFPYSAIPDRSVGIEVPEHHHEMSYSSPHRYFLSIGVDKDSEDINTCHI